MKIVLVTYGSRGDVQPMLTLALALKSAGQDVVLAAPPEKAEWAAQWGCPFQGLGSNVTAFIDRLPDAHSFRSATCFARFMYKEIPAQFETLPKIISGADLVVGSSLVFALSTVAESMGVAYRYIAFTPQLIPSSHHPFPAFKNQMLPRWGNVLTWRVAKLLDRFNLTRLVNRRRKRFGLSPVTDFWLHILGHHVIVASDKVICQVPPDVAPAYTQTGYMHLSQPRADFPELEAFLGAGTSPIFAGFGSMPKRDQAENVSMIVEAARATGRRVVISRFWNGPSDSSGSGDVFFIQKYPHLHLFPRMAAVIHHGGAGTTATAAAGGAPQIIVPHILDQYYWGHQVHRSGLGPKPIWRSRLTARRLAAAIHECLEDDRFRQRAQNASVMIRPQESLEMTVSEILTV